MLSFTHIFLTISLFFRERESSQEQKEGERERESPQADSLLSGESKAGLDFRTLRS